MNSHSEGSLLSRRDQVRQSISDRIEQYLLNRAEWVPKEELCEVFNLSSDRPLRGTGNKPGLCTVTAINSEKGFKHVALASTDEYLKAKNRKRRHAIVELVNLRARDRHRQAVRKQLASRKHKPVAIELDTGQCTFGLTTHNTPNPRR